VKKRVLVTGACGMLGRAFMRQLSETYAVTGLDLKKDNNAVIIDITDKRNIIREIKKIKPDVVIHTAAYTNVDGCEENKKDVFNINVTGTQNVALGCNEVNSLLVYISTDFVFDGEKSAPYTEKDTPNPISVYGKSKLEGERCIGEILNKFTIVRSSWIFGKYGANFVDAILQKAEKEKEIKVVAGQVGSPTYVEDLAGAIIKLMECIIDRPTGGIYHITNSGSTSWDNYAREILRYSDISNVKINSITANELARPAKRPKMSMLDNSLYQATTGNGMRNYREALKEYILEGRK